MNNSRPSVRQRPIEQGKPLRIIVSFKQLAELEETGNFMGENASGFPLNQKLNNKTAELERDQEKIYQQLEARTSIIIPKTQKNTNGPDSSLKETQIQKEAPILNNSASKHINKREDFKPPKGKLTKEINKQKFECPGHYVRYFRMKTSEREFKFEYEATLQDMDFVQNTLKGFDITEFEKVIDTWEKDTEENRKDSEEPLGPVLPFQELFARLQGIVYINDSMISKLTQIYEYWKNKRTLNKKSFLRRFWPRADPYDSDPNVTFRPLDMERKRRFLRSNKKREDDYAQKLDTLNTTFKCTLELAKQINKREAVKRKLLELSQISFEQERAEWQFGNEFKHPDWERIQLELFHANNEGEAKKAKPTIPDTARGPKLGPKLNQKRPQPEPISYDKDRNIIIAGFEAASILSALAFRAHPNQEPIIGSINTYNRKDRLDAYQKIEQRMQGGIVTRINKYKIRVRKGRGARTWIERTMLNGPYIESIYPSPPLLNPYFTPIIENEGSLENGFDQVLRAEFGEIIELEESDTDMKEIEKQCKSMSIKFKTFKHKKKNIKPPVNYQSLLFLVIAQLYTKTQLVYNQGTIVIMAHSNSYETYIYIVNIYLQFHFNILNKLLLKILREPYIICLVKQ